MTFDKSKLREMIAIGFPAVLESLVSVIVATIDTKMISAIGTEPISAVAFTTQPKLVVYSIFFALGTAMSIFIAQANGRNDQAEARNYFSRIVRITIILGILLGALLAVFARPVMALCSRQTETLDMSVTFFRILMAGLVLQGLITVLNGALRGIGKTRLTLISGIVMGLVDILFNYLLIEGHLGFPRLEVAGDAIATTLGIAAACLVTIIAIAKETDLLSMRELFRRNDDTLRQVRKEIIAKAGNLAQENILLRVGFLISSIIVSCLAPDETSVYSVAMILLTYSFAFGDGIQNAVIALVGRSKGAKNIPEIREHLKNGLFIGTICSVALGLIYVLTSKWFLGLYFDEDTLIKMGVKMIWFAAGISLFQILRIVYIASLRGVGETRIPKWIALACVLLINPGTGALFVFVFDLGIWGIWLSSVVTQIIWFLAGSITSRKYINQLKEE